MVRRQKQQESRTVHMLGHRDHFVDLGEFLVLVVDVSRRLLSERQSL